MLYLNHLISGDMFLLRPGEMPGKCVGASLPTHSHDGICRENLAHMKAFDLTWNCFGVTEGLWLGGKISSPSPSSISPSTSRRTSRREAGVGESLGYLIHLPISCSPSSRHTYLPIYYHIPSFPITSSLTSILPASILFCCLSPTFPSASPTCRLFHLSLSSCTRLSSVSLPSLMECTVEYKYLESRKWVSWIKRRGTEGKLFLSLFYHFLRRHDKL